MHFKSLIETLKHAIVCLQIAKANCDPSNVIDSTEDLREVLSHFDQTNLLTMKNKINSFAISATSTSSAQLSNSTSISNDGKLKPNASSTIQTSITQGDGETRLNEMNVCNNRADKSNDTIRHNDEDTKINNKTKKKRLKMPVSSYSSSDDETQQSKQKDHSSSSGMENFYDHRLEEDEDTVDETDFYESNFDRSDDDDMNRNNNHELDDNDSESFYDAIDQNMATAR
jgi:hypothetical protein